MGVMQADPVYFCDHCKRKVDSGWSLIRLGAEAAPHRRTSTPYDTIDICLTCFNELPASQLLSYDVLNNNCKPPLSELITVNGESS